RFVGHGGRDHGPPDRRCAQGRAWAERGTGRVDAVRPGRPARCHARVVCRHDRELARLASDSRVNRIVVVASHRRSGTHLMLDSLRSNVRDVHGRFMTLERIEPSHEKHLPIAEFDRRLRSQRGIVLVKTHPLPSAGAWQAPGADEYASELLATAPTIYVHRDGRDVLVSLYRFVQSYSAQVAEQSFAGFLRANHTGLDAAGISRPAYWQR